MCLVVVRRLEVAEIIVTVAGHAHARGQDSGAGRYAMCVND